MFFCDISLIAFSCLHTDKLCLKVSLCNNWTLVGAVYCVVNRSNKEEKSPNRFRHFAGGQITHLTLVKISQGFLM